MNITVRKETAADYKVTEEVVKTAFSNMVFSDKREHELVARIRKSNVFIPELSLVAIHADINRIIGHILLSEIKIAHNDQSTTSLALAPVSVLPGFQNKGIGRLLILEALTKARELGYQSVIVMGHPEYYPKFGFKPASLWGIKAPFEVSNEAFMALELHENILDHVSGVVQYPSIFFE